MFGSDVLDVGIGMSLLFLMMSLIATAVREAIEGVIKSRAADLEKGLGEMLNETNGANNGLVTQIYKHGLINSLYRGTLDTAKKSRDLPSYIPSKIFVSALLDIVLRCRPVAANAPALAPGTAPTLNEARTVLTIENLRSCAGNLPPAVKHVVLGAIDDAQGDIDAVRKNLEDWFNASMDRVSGWYRRRTQLILFVIGIVVAFALNVDSITIAQRLTNDKTLRDGIVATAQRRSTVPVDTKKSSYDDLSEELNKIGFPIGWLIPDIMGPDGRLLPKQLRDLGRGIYLAPQMCKSRTDCSFEGGALLLAIVGWFVTAFAIMLGAPFWFDVLNRFMVIRSTIKPSEKSKDEASKDGGSPPPFTFVMPPTAAAPAPAARPPRAAPPKPR
jgi:hypothetical protein